MTGLIVAVVLVCDLQSATWETIRSTRNGSWSNDARITWQTRVIPFVLEL